jgi:hypothetical protein
MRYAWLVILAAAVAACNPSQQETPETVTGGASVSSYAQTPLAKATTSLALDGSKAKPGQFAIADVISYGGAKPTITAPEGWTLLRDDSSPATRQSLYWHLIKANDPSPTWTFSEPVDAQGAILLLDNVAADNPIDGSSGNTGGPGVVAKSVTTTKGGGFILAFFATNFGGGGLGEQCPSSVSVILSQESQPREYWVVGSYQGRKGDTPEVSCPSGQLYNAVAAQVAIARGTTPATSP